MGKDVKKRFTVSIELDKKDLKKQFEGIGSDIKTLLADIGKASDKMGYFKELVDYIGQIDKALTELRTNNKDAFEHMFDGLDANLKQVMESIFDTSGQTMSALDDLRNKISDASKNGASVKELRIIAEEINSLFESVGKLPPIDIEDKFTGRGDASKRIAILQGSLEAFATVWEDVNQKIKNGFVFGGAGRSGSATGSGDVEAFSEAVQQQINELKKKIEELEDVRDKFDKVAKTVKLAKSKGDEAIPDSYKSDLTVDSVQKLIDEFDALHTQLESGDKSSSEYYNNLIKITEVTLMLKKALSDVRADDSIKKIFAAAPGGRDGNMIGKLSAYANAKSSSVLSQVEDLIKNNGIELSIQDLFNQIEAIKTEAINNAMHPNGETIIDTNKIKREIDELEKQAHRLQEIKLLFDDLKFEKQAFDAGEGLSENFEVEKTVESIQELIANYRKLVQAKDDFEKSGDTSSTDYYKNLAELSKVILQLEDVYGSLDDDLEDVLSAKKIGRGDLLGSLEKVAEEIDGFFDNTFISVSTTIDKLIDESTTKLQSLRTDLQKAQEQIKSQPKTGASGKTSGSGSGTGTGSGSGGTITNVDFTSLENTIKSEIASLYNKLDSVFKVEVVKNDTADIKSAIEDVRLSIERISAEIDDYNALRNTNAKQSEINTMKNNLTQLLKFVSDFNAKKVDGKFQHQEIGAAILSDGTISTGYGEHGTVPWDRMASSLVSNLAKSLLVDIHSHPWGQNGILDHYANDSFSGSSGDLGAFRFSKELGAQMAAMITGNVMRTLDLSKLTDAQMMKFRSELSKIEKTHANTPEYSKYMEYTDDKLYYHSQSTLSEQHKVTEAFESLMYKAFERIGFSKDKVDQEIFKKYDLTDDKQLTALAERLVYLSQVSQNALSPVERLSEIISHFRGNVYSDKAKADFEAYTKGEMTAADVFNDLNGMGYRISQDTLDSLYKIDTANEVSAVESLLTQVVNILNAIDSSVANINSNTRPSTSEKFDTAINDILDLRNGVDSKNVLAGIKSIFDPLNISEYKNKEVMQIADSAVLDAKDYISDLYINSNYADSVNIDELQVALDKFYLALSYVKDALKQEELYASRTGKPYITNDGYYMSNELSARYEELTDEGLLNNLLKLLSQAKIDIQNGKHDFQDGFTGLPEGDNDLIVGGLQSIQSILDSIYGVLHGFTGIDADNKNSFKYREPSVDTGVTRKEFSEQDLSVLNTIVQVLQSIDNYLYANKIDNEPDDVKQNDNDILELSNFVKAKLSQQPATEDTLLVVKSIIENLYNKLSQQDNKIDSDNKTDSGDQGTEDNQGSDVYKLLANKLPQNVASEDTLQAIKSAIEQLADALKVESDDNTNIDQSLNTLISALTANVTTLKDVASGIVRHQKAQKSDTSKAMARIQSPTEQQIISGIAKDSVVDLGTEVEIESLQALANGLVKVEGAFKNANGQWEGFSVKVNEANAAVDLAIKKQSAFARALNKAKDIDDNTYVYSKEEVEARAQKHLEEYAAQGKNATVQFKDSGRYTITILEEIDGLSKQIFQTFDENDDKIERTTVTMSNSQKMKLDNLQKKLIENGLSNGLISDKDSEYNQYQAAADALSNMTDAYSKLDNISDAEIANWKQQIELVQQLGGQVEALIKQRKLANDQKVFESDRGKKLSKFDLDKATLQNSIAIPESFNQRMDDARKDIENAVDNDSLKIAINNWDALQNEIKKTAAEQDLYIKKTKKVKGTTAKPDQFTKDLAKQKTDFAKYKTDVQNALGVTDELKNRLNQLETDLNSIGDTDGLNKWIQSLKNLKTEISNAQKGFKTSQVAISSEIIGKANSKFRELNFKATDNNLTQEQEEIVNKRKELIQQIKEYNIKVNSGQKAEIDGIKATKDELYKLIDAYKQKYNITNGGGNVKKGKTYGLNQLQTFTARYNSLIAGASDVGLDGQSPAVLNLVNAYKQLQAAQSAFVAGEDLMSDTGKRKVEEFKAAQLACNNYARDLNKIVSSSKKLASESVASDSLAEDFQDTIEGRKAALKDFVNAMYGTNASIDKFDSSFNELNFTVKNGDGTFTKMTATINEARTAIHATAGATGEVTSKFRSFINELSGKFKSIGAYFVASFGWQEIWQQIRRGIEYVREIDGALTELKKVTNETDATYDNFLQSMSKTAGVVGSTVSELTTMAADWARLGYNIEEAGKLAESTAILLNVSEFEDAASASEALISTMQAFQYTADESQHVVDILNEVGNNYAVSSDGIATALQDSASALMEAGNNLEQSVALVAAANKVVQDPNSVGSALRTISLRLRGTSVSILEEMGEETDGVVESVSKMQEKIGALTGVNILTDSGAYKDTYTILKEIGMVWEDMSDIDQAALLELMAGKNRANTLAAILGNMKDLEGAYESALNAEGSAMRENEAYLDSIQGRIDIFNNALQTMWMNFIDSSVVKFVVDFGTALIKAADAMGVLSVASGGWIGIKTMIKSIKTDFASIGKGTFDKDIFGFKKMSESGDIAKKTIQEVDKAIQEQTETQNENTKATKEQVNADVQKIGTQQAENAAEQTGAVQTGIDTAQKIANEKATWGQVAAEKALAVAKGLAKGFLIGAAVSFATTALTSLISAISDASKRMDELTASAIESANETKEAQDSISDYKDEIADLRAELDSNTLSETEAYDARQRLIEIQNELINKFGLEAEGLNIVTGAIEDQIGAIDRLTEKAALDWYKDNQEAYQNAIDEMQKTYKNKDFVIATETGTYTDEYDNDTGLHNYQYKVLSKTLGSATDDVRQAYNDGLKHIIENAGGVVNDSGVIRHANDQLNTYRRTWTASFEGKTAEELDAIFDDMQTFLTQFEVDNGVDLSGQIIDLEQLRKQYIDEDYQDARELYDVGRQQEAYAKYAAQYGAILDAEEEFYQSTTDEDRLAKIEEHNQGVAKAFEKAGGTIGEDGIWKIDEKSSQAHMQEYFADMRDKFASQEFELRVKISKDDENGLQSQLEGIIQKGGESGLSSLDDNQIKELAKAYNDGSFSQSTAGYYIDQKGLGYSSSQIEGITELQKQANAAGISIESLIDILVNLGLVAGRPVDGAADSVSAVSQAYSDLSASVENYANINDVLAEATSDNIELSQEQGEALKELIGSEEEYADCIDESNGYIVKNSALLRKLVAQKKQDQKATIKQAKSNAQLQYKNTVQQLQQVIKAMALEVKATGLVSNGTLNTIGVLREQLTTLKQTIQQYALLELSLSDAANAYSEFEAAKERDAQLTYGDSMIEMLQTINDGFKTGQVGTEAFQFAVEAIVPSEVYQGIDDVEARMIAIHDYIDKNPLFADWFTIDDGEFSITLDNINAFIDDAFNAGLFTHDSSGEFFLNSNFISDSDQEQINLLNETLKEFQNTYNGTVDLVNRKRIDITEDNIDTVRGWGMSDAEVGDYMTVASQTYDDGNVAIVVTPILPNGELMEQDELDAYVDDVIAKTNAGSGNYSDYDTKGILMGVFDDANTWEENLAASDEFVNRVHEIHETINSLGDSATLKDFADALGVTESAALAMLTELEKYDASWGNIISDLTTTELDREIINATDALDEALSAQEEFIRSGGDLNSEEYQKLVENVNSAQTALNDATTAAELNAQKYNQIETAYAALTGEITLTKEAADSLFRSLGFVDANGDVTVQVDDDGTIHMTDEQLKALKASADKITSEPTVMDMQLRYDTIDAQIAELQRYIDEDLNFEDSEIAVTLGIENEEEAKAKVAELTAEQETISLNYNITATTAEQSAGTLEKLTTWETNGLNINISGNTEKLQGAVQEANALEANDKEVDITADPTQANADIDSVDNNEIDNKEPKIIIQGVPVAISQIDSVANELDKITDRSVDISVNKTTYEETKKWNSKTQSWESDVNGTAHVNGTAYANGNWGAPNTEVALTGELGPEMIVRGNRWFTVGDNGAEFTQIKKGDIIFNHKQTEDLLSKGYVTSRGKMTGGAFASGTAYYKTFGGYVGDDDVFKDGSDKWMDAYTNTSSALDNAADSLSSAADDLSDSSDEFREVFDWIEVRLEEIDDAISLKNAKLENKIGHKSQNKVIDDIIELNQNLYDNLIAGANKYYSYANKLISKVPAEYREAAKDGTIAIETFVGEADEKTLEAIQEYREWVQKGDEAAQRAEETLTEISNLAKQAIDNISQDYENKTSLRDNKIDQYEAYNSLLETDVGFESASVYQAMIKENNKNIEALEEQRNKMQEELNKRVESGEIKVGSQDWYDAINDIAAVDTEIINLKTDTENWQDAINELHWEKFDALMSRIEAVSNEAENLIDILSNEDLVDDSGNWTDEGITTLGLYAQQMEAAEVQAKKYEEEIDYLNKNWQKLGYTEEEYLEKLGELKDGQYEAIQAYHDSKDAIVDLNKERIDAIKEGIEKEIEAYEELIEAKKEELDAEKDLYDFQKSVMEQEKDIADIQRQLAALSGDNSASARAKRAQLEAELAEAQAALEESYYERSVSNQQEALDKELENFQDEKNAEMEGWDEYLENTEQVVADSLSTVQANTEAVYATLQAMGQEYGLSITESLTSPWREGETAIQSFSEQFGISMSATVEELQELELEFLSTMAEIEQAGIDAANAVKENAQGYTEAEYKEPKKEEDKKKDDGDKKQEEKKIKVGGKINAKGAKIYDYVGDKSGAKQYYSSDPIYVVLDEKSGYLKVRHHKSKSGVTGWFKKSDVKAYAKGSMGVSEDQWALLHKLGDELEFVPGKNGRLEYVKKGTGIVPADLTERLVNLAMDPQEMLDRNRPSIGVHPEIHHTEISIDNSIGELIHIDHCDQGTLPDVKKIVNDALEKHTQKLNQSLRKFAR